MMNLKTLYTVSLCLLITCLTSSVNGRRIKLRTKIFGDAKICLSCMADSNNVRLVQCKDASAWLIEGGNTARIMVFRNPSICLIADHLSGLVTTGSCSGDSTTQLFNIEGGLIARLDFPGECIGAFTTGSTHFNPDGSVADALIKVTACNQNEKFHPKNILWEVVLLSDLPVPVVPTPPPRAVSSSANTVPLFSTF